jgi:hypothetical protein
LNISEKLNAIQQKLKAPKNQKNTFGGYNYRSCEDILEAVKPLLDDACLTINDEVVQVGDRYYVKATARLFCQDAVIENTAWAREPDAKKGMDEAQITGATSSYARKYALNGLFAIDDTKDPDATNTHGKDDKADEFEKDATAQKKAFNKAVKAGATEKPEEKKPLSERAEACIAWLDKNDKQTYQTAVNSRKDRCHDVRDACLSSGVPELVDMGVKIANKLKDFEPELDDEIIY